MHVVSAALHARGRPVLRVLGVPVLRSAHAVVQAVPPVVPGVHGPGPVQLLGVHVPVTPGPEELAVRVVLRAPAARRLLQLQQGHGRVSQPDAGRETPDVVGRRRTGQPDRRRSRRFRRRLLEPPRPRRVRLLGVGRGRVRPGRSLRDNGECARSKRMRRDEIKADESARRLVRETDGRS